MTQRLRSRSSAADTADPLHVRTAHVFDRLPIYAVQCRHISSPAAPKRTDQIVLPRRGMFARETRGETTLADADHVLCFSRADCAAETSAARWRSSP
jgi:hypothetical protein